MQDNTQRAVYELLGGVHRRPDLTHLWSQLGEFLLTHFADDHRLTAAHCALVALAGDVTAHKVSHFVAYLFQKSNV